MTKMTKLSANTLLEENDGELPIVYTFLPNGRVLTNGEDLYREDVMDLVGLLESCEVGQTLVEGDEE